MKKFIINIIILIFIIILGMGTISSLAMQDYQENKAMTLRLSYFRYSNGQYVDGYALNTVGDEGESHHPIYQIMDESNNKNYYCLNAKSGESWLSGTVGASATYNRSYDLNSQSDINLLKADSSLSETYRNVVNSSYFNQIMWILDNMYVQEQDSNQKQELLAKAGIVYGDVDNIDTQGKATKGYRYIAQTGYNYSSKVSTQGKKGYFYYDESGTYHSVELPDEMLEVAGQTALWYFTNYLDNNSQNSQTYNVKDQWLPLLCSNGNSNTNINQWDSLESETFYENTNVSNVKAEVGKWKQEQAAILCQYLIDAANKYAASSSESTGNPLEITPEQPNITLKNIGGSDNYVVGPIKIDEKRTIVYSLNNKIYVNDSTETGAYISDESGNQSSDQTIANYIGKEFYVSIPKNSITGNDIKIGFNGTYKTNQKTLWISTTKTEQPVAEVTHKNEPFELEVNTELTEINVTKIWDDYANKENTRKNYGVTLTGKVGSQIVYTNTINLEPSVTTYTWTGLAKYKDGQQITYTIDETTVPDGYTKTVNGYTITNKFETKTQISGAKTWVDYNNKDNTRPSTIRVYLVKNGTKTNTYKDVTEADDWKYSFENLDKYDDNNNLISYSVQEEFVNNYTTTYDGNNITNTYTTKTGINGIKTWVDYNNKDNTRPSTIRVYLVKNGTKTNTYKDVTEADGWKYSFENLDKYDDNNNLISYSVQEEKVDNYTTTYDGNNITNKYTAKTSIEGTKTWIDNDNKDNTRPSKIRVYLVKNGTKTNTYKDVTEADGWKYSFTDLEKYDSNNNLISYSVEEDTIDNYITTYDGNNITNTYTAMTQVSGTKTWKDYDNKENTRPSTIRVYLVKNGTRTETYKDVTAANGWRYSFTDLEKYDESNNPISYSVEEEAVENYTTTYDGNNITNTFTIKTEIDGTKTWIDNANQNNTRPEKIRVYLVKNGTKTNDYRDVAEADGWKYSFTDLEKYDENNNLISYSVEEEAVENYTATYDGYNITNKYKSIDLALRKNIKQITDSANKTRLVENEAGNLATRKINYNANSIKTTGTATYNHRKDPVVVQKGDTVTYEITVYNEGEVNGYALEIVDKLPDGLKLKGGNTGKYKSGNIEYSYVYDEKTNEITIKNISKNVLKAYDGSEKLSSETIEVQCEVVENPLTTTNTYLINIAYISKEYNSETNKEISKDRDSNTTQAPSTEQKTTGDKYTGYHGGDNNNGGNDKDVYKDGLGNDDYFPGKEDDDDFEVIVIKPEKIDLALTKFITAISDDMKIEDGEYLTKNGKIGSKSNPYTRATRVDTKELRDNKECHDATYIMVKDPLTVPEESYVLYNIRVYNEGEKDVYAGEVADYLPEYLDYVECDFNTSYGWKLGEDKRTVKTDHLAYDSNDKEAKNLLKAFDKKTDDGNGSGLDYRDIQILCKVNSNAPDKTNLVNSAEITKYQDEKGEDISEDIDSKPENLQDKNKEHREEDDDDYEIINIKKKKVDLALTKFITAISNDTKIEDGEYLTADGIIGSKSNPYTRATKVDTKELRDNENCHDATYTMVKDPLTVPAKSYVLYNIRVYNEGETDVYAGEITDHLPDYLDYVDCEFNKEFGWNVASDGKTIKTTYLGYNENDKNAKNLLKAFDKKTDDGLGSGLDYRDVQVLCRVNEKAPSNTNIVNVAEITKYQNPKGDDLQNDIDSTPNNVDKSNEDDDDYEVINVKTFDLSLLKYVSTVYVTEDGETKTTETGNTGDDKKDIIPKVEINKKKLNSTIVKFGYTIKITNEGDIAGYAKEITDYVPEGLQFYAEDNKGWNDEGNNVISTRLLENTLLQPGESTEITVILRWINGSTNLGLKTNTAEISEDYNDWGVPDRDSTPDNKIQGEDDIDDASVLLSISTGVLRHIAIYTIYGVVILIVFAVGIKLIKKHVL